MNKIQQQSRRNDENKNRIARSNNYNLTRIWEDEIEEGFNKLVENLNDIE